MPFCPTCGREVPADAVFCSNCGHDLKQILQAQTAQKVSRWWWLLPIFFTLIGGVIAYVANRETNSKTARHMLILGIIIIPLFFILVFASIAVIGLAYWLTG